MSDLTNVHLQESFLVTDYPWKFSRNSPEFVHKTRYFWGITVLRLIFEKFLRNLFRNFPHKICQISPKYLHGNSCEIPRTWSPCLGEFIKSIRFQKFLGISLEFHPMKILRISPDYFSGNS